MSEVATERICANSNCNTPLVGQQTKWCSDSCKWKAQYHIRAADPVYRAKRKNVLRALADYLERA